jgi:hypothetical protein
MRLTSSAFEHGGTIPPRFTCDGPNVSPPLAFAEIPAGTTSLVLIMDDPDVPRHLRADGMWDHWVVYNIPPDLTGIGEAEEPPGTPGIGTANNTTYFGPCPPDREHRYFFKLYALDRRLNLPAGSSKAQVEAAMEGHILAQSELMGRYERG